MQTNSADNTNSIMTHHMLPAKRQPRLPLSISAAIIIAAITSFSSGWIIRGLDANKRDTQELTIAVKSALNYAEQSRNKDETIARLSEYCVSN